MKFSELPIHHALLITHPNRTLYADALWKEINVISPAHKYFNQTVLDIETARDLISFAQSPYSGEKIALVSFHTATLPAQNALLKILEEPPSNMRFILVTTHRLHVLNTVLSRVFHVDLSPKLSLAARLASVDFSDVLQKESADRAALFLQTEPQTRMKLPHIVELLSAQDEEGRKDREAVKACILSLASVAGENNLSSRYITETLHIASYASDPSASGKALLEYLALLLPVLK